MQNYEREIALAASFVTTTSNFVTFMTGARSGCNICPVERSKSATATFSYLIVLTQFLSRDVYPVFDVCLSPALI
jgi:hypothetical protein